MWCWILWVSTRYAVYLYNTHVFCYTVKNFTLRPSSFNILYLKWSHKTGVRKSHHIEGTFSSPTNKTNTKETNIVPVYTTHSHTQPQQVNKSTIAKHLTTQRTIRAQLYTAHHASHLNTHSHNGPESPCADADCARRQALVLLLRESQSQFNAIRCLCVWVCVWCELKGSLSLAGKHQRSNQPTNRFEHTSQWEPERDAKVGQRRAFIAPSLLAETPPHHQRQQQQTPKPHIHTVSDARNSQSSKKLRVTRHAVGGSVYIRVYIYPCVRVVRYALCVAHLQVTDTARAHFRGHPAGNQQRTTPSSPHRPWNSHFFTRSVCFCGGSEQHAHYQCTHTHTTYVCTHTLHT